VRTVISRLAGLRTRDQRARTDGRPRLTRLSPPRGGVVGAAELLQYSPGVLGLACEVLRIDDVSVLDVATGSGRRASQLMPCAKRERRAGNLRVRPQPTAIAERHRPCACSFLSRRRTQPLPPARAFYLFMFLPHFWRSRAIALLTKMGTRRAPLLINALNRSRFKLRRCGLRATRLTRSRVRCGSRSRILHAAIHAAGTSLAAPRHRNA